jgi:hypothetical protein
MVLNSHPIKKIDSRLSIRPETDNAGELKRLMQVNNLNSIYSKYYEFFKCWPDETKPILILLILIYLDDVTFIQ